VMFDYASLRSPVGRSRDEEKLPAARREGGTQTANSDPIFDPGPVPGLCSEAEILFVSWMMSG
jgi:hypothetical protein